MRNGIQIKTRAKQSTKKKVLLVFFVCFIMLSLLSEAFILTHADHEHDHNGIGSSCTLCVQFHNIESLLKQFAMAVAVARYGFIGLLTVIAILRSISPLYGISTSIELKTQLNN